MERQRNTWVNIQLETKKNILGKSQIFLKVADEDQKWSSLESE